MRFLKKPARQNTSNLGQQNLVRICIRHIQTHEIKSQAAATFRNNNIGAKKFVITEIVSLVAKRAFSFCEKACQSKSFSLWIVKFCQHDHKGRPHKREKSQSAATNMEDAVIIF
jgi:hypothetical protein